MPALPSPPVSYPPSTFDRATGVNGQPGTPTPSDAVIPIVASRGIGATFLEEDPGSPEIERAEQATIVHKFRCDAATGNAIIGSTGRGKLFVDSNGNISRCLSCKLEYQKGGYCIVTVTSESLSFDNPPDEFDLEITELNPGLEKHPRYKDLTYKQRRSVVQTNRSPSVDLVTSYESVINTFPGAPSPGFIGPSDPNAATAYNEAKEMLLKFYKGIDSFYLPGFKIVFSRYFWSPVPLNPGGYIEDPIATGYLPAFFWNTSIPQDFNTANTIFSLMQSINPNIYGPGISWLRMCDSIHYQRTWFKVTSTWQGAPLGHWDNELYTAEKQPYQTLFDQGFTPTP